MEYLMMVLDQATNLIGWATTNYQRPFLLVVFVLVIGFVFFISRSPRH